MLLRSVRVSRLASGIRTRVSQLRSLVIAPEVSYPQRAAERAKLAKQWEEEERAFEQEHAARANAFATPWQLVTATVVERRPIVTFEAPKWESDYREMKEQVEEGEPGPYFVPELAKKMWSGVAAERVVLSDDPATLAAQSPDQVLGELTETEKMDDDLLERRRKQMEAVQDIMSPLPRVTEQDKAGDRHSLYQQLDRYLYLVVRAGDGPFEWRFPHRVRKAGEAMRMSALRAVHRKHFGKDLRLTLHGNGPMAHLKLIYEGEQQAQEKAYGVKLFFYHAVHAHGNVALRDKSVTDHAWLTKAELKGVLHPDYFKAVEPVLLDW